jgi:hypothetical protein
MATTNTVCSVRNKYESVRIYYTNKTTTKRSNEWNRKTTKRMRETYGQQSNNHTLACLFKIINIQYKEACNIIIVRAQTDKNDVYKR